MLNSGTLALFTKQRPSVNMECTHVRQSEQRAAGTPNRCNHQQVNVNGDVGRKAGVAGVACTGHALLEIHRHAVALNLVVEDAIKLAWIHRAVQTLDSRWNIWFSHPPACPPPQRTPDPDRMKGSQKYGWGLGALAISSVLEDLCRGEG